MLDGDFVLLSDGVYDLVEDEEKAAQDIAESLQNNYDSEDPSWFNGSELFRLIGDPAFAVRAVRAGLTIETLLHSIVEEAIVRLMDLQDEDDYITDKERISEIQTLQVRRLGNGSSYFFYLVCLNDSNEPIRTDFIIRLIPDLPPGMNEHLAGGTEAIQDVTKTFL
jgi:hypothetical protein